ncbi:MAG: fumarylacetoacetate hydrolase family protein [Pigmentiphaga sp.]|uniref:fumarylacetoacetate hydrolase family protein n=1 Tax=Pigmentiphaga sp. TaxID=1977564 RepID=UPI0029AFA195|nr:fumarylacetoacetate hydrolase family protein [Pigmentiphaga sp.]MDX3905935.1 fumarylacetoacetate hydrolase family protein [Pigmentiphaga sp.]
METHPAPFALGTFSEPDGTPFVALVVEEQRAVPLAPLAAEAGTPWSANSVADLLGDWDGALARIDRILARAGAMPPGIPVDGLLAHAPVAPRQIVCVGANYRKHVIDLVMAQGAGAETENMSVEQRRDHVARRTDARARDGIPYAFPRLSGALCGPSDPVVIPRDAEQFDWELELAVVIGREAWRVPRERALDFVAGYTVVNDLTRRELVYRPDIKSLGSDWLRAKSGPGFMPCGPFLLPARFVPDPQSLHIEFRLNGEVMQSESTADMLFDVARQIEYISSYVRLFPGDLVATGSPAGNGMHYGRFLRPGDVMEGRIAGMGTQRNLCVAEGA